MTKTALQPVETDVIASALRTIGIERQGLASLEEALRDGLGEPFRRAVDLIAGLSGRLIITGVGKSGHIGAKLAASFASTGRSEEHTSELQSLMRSSYAVFCLNKKKNHI